MTEIRLSKKTDVPYLKEIWKACFGDDDRYIDFFFNNKYEEDKTFVLLYGTNIASMLTIIPIQMVLPDNRSYPSAMLYAIATHPKFQGKGFSTQIMDHIKQYLFNNKIDILTLVPANKSLVEFYNKRGYTTRFYIKEFTLTYNMIKNFTSSRRSQFKMVSATPEEYNKERRKQLKDSFYVAYSNDGIAYQKKISRLSKADIYTFYAGDIQGCVAIERISAEKIIIKEILISEHLLIEAFIKIVKLLPAKEYIVRLPVNTGQVLSNIHSITKGFGMIRFSEKLNIDMCQETPGYLGLAYD